MDFAVFGTVRKTCCPSLPPPQSDTCKAPLAGGVRCQGGEANRCPLGQEKFCHNLPNICSPPHKRTCFKDIFVCFPWVHFGVSVTFSLYWTRNLKVKGLVWAKLNLQPKQDWFCEVPLGSLSPRIKRFLWVLSLAKFHTSPCSAIIASCLRSHPAYQEGSFRVETMYWISLFPITHGLACKRHQINSWLHSFWKLEKHSLIC